MTVTRWPQATQRETCPYRLVPVPPPWGWVQSRSVSSRMCRGAWVGAGCVTRGREATDRAGGRTSGASIEWAHVPSVCRRIVVLLVAACLGAAAAPLTPALAQGA